MPPFGPSIRPSVLWCIMDAQPSRIAVSLNALAFRFNYVQPHHPSSSASSRSSSPPLRRGLQSNIVIICGPLLKGTLLSLHTFFPPLFLWQLTCFLFMQDIISSTSLLAMVSMGTWSNTLLYKEERAPVKWSQREDQVQTFLNKSWSLLLAQVEPRRQIVTKHTPTIIQEERRFCYSFWNSPTQD